MRNGARGFTLIEALVAVVLAGIGVVAALNGISSLTRSQALLAQKETLYRLACKKYDDIASQPQPQSESGDFSEVGESRYLWSSEVATTGVENVSLLTVTVSFSDEVRRTASESVEGLIYRIPVSTTGGTP